MTTVEHEGSFTKLTIQDDNDMHAIRALLLFSLPRQRTIQ